MKGRFESPRTPRVREPRAKKPPREKKPPRVRQPRAPRVWTARQKVLFLLCIVLTLASVVSGLYFRRASHALVTQSAADAWRGESEQRFAQVSVFLPAGSGVSEDSIRSFRQEMMQELTNASLETPEGGRLWNDCWCAMSKLELTGKSGSCTVTAIGVAGDFFLFHPLPLRSGSYLTSEDYMGDRIVLDEQASWALFGGENVAGMDVDCGGRPYPVAGVVAREKDFATKRACEDMAIAYMSMDAFRQLTQSAICSYEVVMPEPITGFAKKVVSEKFPVGDGIVVQNTNRYSLKNLYQVLRDFGVRSMNTHAVIYPYWENAARLTEDHAAMSLLLCILFALIPAVMVVYVSVRLIKKTAVTAAEAAAEAIEEKVEENKEKHYVRTGI